MKIKWLKRSVNDIDNLFDYIAADNPLAAEREVLKVVRSVELISENPFIGHAGRVPETREFAIPKTPYVLIYRVKNEMLELLRVFHGSRQWPPD